jgi:hypothetical protein
VNSKDHVLIAETGGDTILPTLRFLLLNHRALISAESPATSESAARKTHSSFYCACWRRNRKLNSPASICIYADVLGMGWTRWRGSKLTS